MVKQQTSAGVRGHKQTTTTTTTATTISPSPRTSAQRTRRIAKNKQITCNQSDHHRHQHWHKKETNHTPQQPVNNHFRSHSARSAHTRTHSYTHTHTHSFGRSHKFASDGRRCHSPTKHNTITIAFSSACVAHNNTRTHPHYTHRPHQANQRGYGFDSILRLCVPAARSGPRCGFRGCVCSAAAAAVGRSVGRSSVRRVRRVRRTRFW